MQATETRQATPFMKIAAASRATGLSQFYLRQGYAPEGEGEAVVYGERLVWKKMAKRLRDD